MLDAKRTPWLNSNNRSGYTGVSWDKQGQKWRACVRLRGKTVHLGFFEDVHDAGIAACDFRLAHEAERMESKAMGNENRSRSIKQHLASLSPEERRRRTLQGLANRRDVYATSRSGVTGVTWDTRRERWYVAVVTPEGKRIRRGSSKDLQAAIAISEEYYTTLATS